MNNGHWNSTLSHLYNGHGRQIGLCSLLVDFLEGVWYAQINSVFSLSPFVLNFSALVFSPERCDILTHIFLIANIDMQWRQR